MPKYTILFISLILLIVVSIYTGIWFRSITFEGLNEGTIIQTATDANGNVATVRDINGNVVGNVVGNVAKYNPDNLNVTYHDDPQTTGSNDIYGRTMGTAKVFDVSGNLIDIVSNAVQGNIVYYQPGSYKYGATSYVPYYEDSVYLSRTANVIANTPTQSTKNVVGGFCNKYKNDYIKIEENCNAINNNSCAATTCCILFGGQKCVAGNEKGPIMKENYSDFKILNKDFYYYKGKCYGNCPNTPQFPEPRLPNKLPYMPAAPGGR